ncbi:MAG: peptidase, partial [Nitrosopumilus sp.]
PAWVKNNAGWWAEGTISETEFLSGIEFLIKDGIISVPPTTVSAESSEGVPAWVKNNAGWWAEGTISDGEFVNGIQHLMKTGLISVIVNEKPEEMISPEPQNTDSKLAALEAELEACSEIVKAYKRIDCQKPIEKEIALYNYKMNAKSFEVGPITYYWNGVGSEGNEFQISPTGQAILSIRMLAENTSSEIVGLNCTSPQICAYDVWDGSKAFKYSGMDFTSGQINLNPNDSKEFNILFGPNIGYGGTQFQYDSSKNYEFRISENFGSVSVPLNLK